MPPRSELTAAANRHRARSFDVNDVALRRRIGRTPGRVRGCGFRVHARPGRRRPPASRTQWREHKLPDDRHRTSTFSIVLGVVEAGVAAANRLTAAAAAGGSRVAGRERVDGKPGDADLPVEECADSAGALFPLRPIEGGARLREHVTLTLTLGLAKANRLSHARLDGRSGPVADRARVWPGGAARVFEIGGQSYRFAC